MRTTVAIAIAAAALVGACDTPSGRSVRTWIEARDAEGETVAGAEVSVDGRPLGITDHRGMFRVKVRRHVGASVAVSVVDEEPPQYWSGAFEVGTNGGVAGGGDRLVVVLVQGPPPRAASVLP